METTLINQGFSLMLYGMGVVFAFLTMLIYATGWMSSLVMRWFPEKEIPVTPRKTIKKASGSVSPLTLKVIQAAVEQHRQRTH